MIKLFKNTKKTLGLVGSELREVFQIRKEIKKVFNESKEARKKYDEDIKNGVDPEEALEALLTEIGELDYN